MDKGKVIALCVFVLTVAFIYADQNRNETAQLPDDSTDKPPHKGGGPSSPIIIPPMLNLSIYENENCTTELASIDWGTMSLGENKSVICYVKNVGTKDVAPILWVENWQFTDYNGTILNTTEYQQYFTLSWDCEGLVIYPNEVVTATIYLYVSPEIHDVVTFSFDIHLGWYE